MERIMDPERFFLWCGKMVCNRKMKRLNVSYLCMGQKYSFCSANHQLVSVATPLVYDKNFPGGRRGGDTFKTPSPTNSFCLYPYPVLRCFWKDPLMTLTPPPHHPTTRTFHCYPLPLPIHHPSLPKNFNHTLVKRCLLFIWLNITKK